jgi:hypothetical protein
MWDKMLSDQKILTLPTDVSVGGVNTKYLLWHFLSVFMKHDIMSHSVTSVLAFFFLEGAYVVNCAIDFGNTVKALGAHYTGDLCPLRFCWIRLNKQSLFCESTARSVLWTSFSLWLLEILLVPFVRVTLRITELFVIVMMHYVYHEFYYFRCIQTGAYPRGGGAAALQVPPPNLAKPKFKKYRFCR